MPVSISLTSPGNFDETVACMAHWSPSVFMLCLLKIAASSNNMMPSIEIKMFNSFCL